MIVITDAMGVRRTAGEEGKAIERIAKKTGVRIGKYHLALGHNPKEVLVGSLIGFVVSVLVYIL